MTRLFALALTACLLPLSAHAEDRRVMLTGFDTIRIDGPFRVAATTGKPSGATISGDSRAIDMVDVHVEGRVLIVAESSNDWGGWPGARHERATITVTSHDIREAAVRGGGSLTLDRAEGMDVQLGVIGSGAIDVADVQADSINGVVAGSGLLKLSGKAANARFANSGSGRIDATALTVQDLYATSDGTGASSFTAERSADVTALGVGDVRIEGDPACKIHGPGPVVCGEKRP
ncbi:DUF2807 domain-containing protein [Stakelama sp. CBK3Z-3]|uniref:DUF2807 domain-containing protein n=1 Tax=Stakelama flava TaxID=2860338 RepID=A0ABS6XKF2_9SPHN|nr:head GIN domain-containing protein [Stakelama flava]MBW4330655.1 DUF2807 domain-containing protein [Stakelama flava]